MNRSQLTKALQTLEFLDKEIRLKVATTARLRAGNPWPEGVRVVSEFVGCPRGPGDNPRWKYTGLVYQLNGEWYLTFQPTERDDTYFNAAGDLLESPEVISWLYKPPEVKVIRSISLRSVVWIMFYDETHTIEDE